VRADRTAADADVGAPSDVDANVGCGGLGAGGHGDTGDEEGDAMGAVHWRDSFGESVSVRGQTLNDALRFTLQPTRHAQFLTPSCVVLLDP
jgi:hypothetical protein